MKTMMVVLLIVMCFVILPGYRHGGGNGLAGLCIGFGAGALTGALVTHELDKPAPAPPPIIVQAPPPRPPVADYYPAPPPVSPDEQCPGCPPDLEPWPGYPGYYYYPYSPYPLFWYNGLWFGYWGGYWHERHGHYGSWGRPYHMPGHMGGWHRGYAPRHHGGGHRR